MTRFSRPTRITLGVFAAMLFAAGATVFVSWTRGGGIQLDEETVARGRALYAEHCASCHGADLEGETNWQKRKADGTLPAPPHDETGHTWHHPNAMLFAYTKLGGDAVAPDDFRSAMPGFGGTLSDDEIWAVLSYIQSTWPEEIRAAREQRSP